MDGIKFTLNGKTAFFKQPDVNSYCYFTYGNIHKPCLLGMLGSMLGLDGRLQQKVKIDNGENIVYPEYYEKLNGLKISIVPKKSKFYKSIQSFNNSTGHASKELGGVLIVRQQWLEDVEWDVYLLKGSVDKELWNRLVQYLRDGYSVYPMYLGANNHFAEISNVKEIALDKIEEVYKINSLYVDEGVELGEVIDIEQEEFTIGEYLPIALNETTNLYVKKKVKFTNREVLNVINTNNFYGYEDNVLYFI